MRCGVVGGIFLIHLAGAAPAVAQQVLPVPQQPPAQKPIQKPAPTADRRRWEFEAHLSWGSSDAESGGKGTLPPAGASFQTAGGSTSRRVPSWYFGDGAVLINDVLKSYGRVERLAPLDEVLTGLAAEETIDDGFGGRVTYAWRPRLTIEVGFEYSPATYTVTSNARTSLKATSDAFVTAFGGLVSSGQGVAMLDPAITSAQSATNGTGADMLVTGALVFQPKPRRLRPYLVAGGGLAIATGHAEATLAGHYAFRLPSSAQIDETDAVTVRFAGGTGLVLLGGGGVKWRVWRQVGVQADGRILLVEHHLNTLIDTHPGRGVVTAGRRALVEPHARHPVFEQRIDGTRLEPVRAGVVPLHVARGFRIRDPLQCLHRRLYPVLKWEGWAMRTQPATWAVRLIGGSAHRAGGGAGGPRACAARGHRRARAGRWRSPRF